MKKFYFIAAVSAVLLALCSAAWADVDINAANFPDETFRACAGYFDADKDGVLSNSEINSVDTLNISSGDITSLKGIEYFTALTYLDCSSNLLTELDVSACTNLLSLFCHDNKLTSLNIKGCAVLRELSCSNNQLASLNLSGSPALTHIICNNNVLNSLDFSNCHNLVYLECNNNNLYLLDLTPCSGILNIECMNNKLVSLKADHLQSLKELDCSNNNLEVLDLSSCFNMIGLDCSHNRLKNLVLTDCYSLQVFSCSNNQLTSIDTSIFTYLWLLYAHDNPMMSFDLSVCDNISLVRCDSYVNRGASSWKFNVVDIAKALKLEELVDFVGNLDYITAYTLDEATGDGIMYPASIDLEVTDDGELFICVDFDAEGEKQPQFSYLSFYFISLYNTAIKVDVFPNTLFASEVPLISTETLADGFAGSAYGFKLSAEGARTIAWSAADGTLPEGLTLSEAGYISGTPASAGTFTFTVQAVNEAGKDAKAFTLTVSDVPENTKPAITTAELPPSAVGSIYNCQLMASGTSPFKWTVKGTLPAGLTLSESGLITGTPAKKGSKKLTLTAKNEYGSDTKKRSLTVYEMPQITTESLKDAELGKRYNFSLKSKGTKPLTWEIGGELPQGITFDAAKGKFSGTPAANDEGKVRITLRNPAGEVSKVFTLKVKAAAPVISTKTLSAGTWGKNYKASISVKGTKPISIYVDGELPAGLAFNSTTGKFEGIPTETCTNRKIKVIAANAEGYAEKEFSLTVKAAAPKILTKSLPDAKTGTEYSAELEAAGTPSITWSATGLPEGLAISQDGTISGTPSKAGKFKVKVTAENSTKKTSKNYTLKVIATDVTSSSTSDDTGTTYAHIIGGGAAEVNVLPDFAADGSVYEIVAELGTVSVDVAGMYDFSVTLSPDVEGELLYLAGNSEPCEDDNIAEFFDAEGAETDVVPEDRKLTLSVWLNPNRTYKPSIAVKR